MTVAPKALPTELIDGRRRFTGTLAGIEGDEVLLDKVVRIPIGDTYSEEFTKVIEGSIFFKDKDSATLIDKRLTN